MLVALMLRIAGATHEAVVADVVRTGANMPGVLARIPHAQDPEFARLTGSTPRV